MAEITSVLFYNVMRYDPKNPRNPAGDRFVLSKVDSSNIGVCVCM
jgi:transketolase